MKAEWHSMIEESSSDRAIAYILRVEYHKLAFVLPCVIEIGEQISFPFSLPACHKNRLRSAHVPSKIAHSNSVQLVINVRDRAEILGGGLFPALAGEVTVAIR